MKLHAQHAIIFGIFFSLLVTAATAEAQTGNSAPTISGVPAATATVGSLYSFTPTAADANGDKLAFVIAVKPIWATFNTATGRLSGTPTAAHVRTYTDIVIAVSDGKTYRTIPTFSIKVVAASSGSSSSSVSSSVSSSSSSASSAATPPAISISTNPSSITSGGSSTLTWSSANTTSCTASGAWSGTKAVAGTLVLTPTTTSTYSLSCTGAGGTVSKAATLNVSSTPTLSISANPISIPSGSSSTLTWSSTSATSCVASGAWSGAQMPSGTYTTPPLTTSSTYTLTCTGNGGSVSGMASVAIASTAAPTADSASKQGPYAFQAYTAGISTPQGATYASPMIYYPTNGSPPYPGIVFIPGNNDDYREDMNTIPQWGNLLASHGFVVMFINPTNLGALPDARANVLIKGMDALAAENTRSGSPLMGKLATQRMAVIGHSFGGAGALYAANTNDPRLKAAIGLNPVPNNGLYPNSHVPSLIVAGYGDPYVANTMQQYDSIPATTPKIHAEFAKTSDVLISNMHFIAHTPIGPLATHKNDPLVARIGLSFLKVYLMGDLRYQQFLVTDPAMYQREAGGDMFRYNNP